MEKTTLTDLKDAILTADSDRVDDILASMDADITFAEIVNTSINPALDSLCTNIQEKNGAIPELLMGLRQVQKVITSKSQSGATQKHKILMGVVEGDIHDMGKNVIRDICRGYGFEVIDLGKNVPVTKFLEVAGKEHIDITCLSTMMSTTIDVMGTTVSELKKHYPAMHILVGGAFINNELAERLNADGYAEDASTIMTELKRMIH